MNKSKIEAYATNSRKQLINDLTYEASRIGITEDEINKPITKTDDMEVYKVSEKITHTLYTKQIEQRKELVNEIKNNGFNQTIEKIAYTWFNRIIAIRYMEVNDYLPTRTRVLSSEMSGKNEPDIITEALDLDLNYSEEDIQQIFKLKEENKTDELFKLLFIKQCNKLNEILPELFEKIDDYTEILFNISLSNEDNIINKLVCEIPEEDFKNQVEIIGWMYQYYISEKKDNVININKGSIKKEDIPAATQLFTTDWIVKYMVENTLGRYYIEHDKSSSLNDELDYLVKDNLQYSDNNINIETLKFIDPCMGSGHILVYAFEIFMKIYQELGYSKKEIPQIILENNIYGIDIDERAYQLAYFALMMKARKYDRNILNKQINVNLLSIKEPFIHKETLENMKNYDAELYDDIIFLIDTFRNAKATGSLIQINREFNYNELKNKLNDFLKDNNNSLMILQLKEDTQNIHSLLRQAMFLSSKYNFVVTNPPYLNKFDKDLKKFANTYYKDYSKDFFSMFIYHNLQLCKEDGYTGYMTPFVWMFIKNYQKLREYIINNKSIVSLIQLEYSAFTEATVPICTFILSNNTEITEGYFIKLSEFKGGMDVQNQKVLEAINNTVDYTFNSNPKNLLNIPGSPIAYWVEDNVVNSFNNSLLSSYSKILMGIKTANNNKYMRMFWEIDKDKLYDKWIPCAKGGEYRKYYGNIDMVIDWSNEACNFYKTNKSSSILSEDAIFKKGITFSSITSKGTGFRYLPSNSLFSSGGDSIINIDDDFYLYILGFLNSKLALYYLNMLNPTINIKLYNIAALPVIISDEFKLEIDNLTRANIDVSHKNWDAYENSIDFKKHPFLFDDFQKIKLAWDNWNKITSNQFTSIKDNEENINRYFNKIYNVESVNPLVDDKDIIIKVASMEDDVKSFISYAIGCMFGRYSLDKEGVISAGNFNMKDYERFVPDDDNIIPILDTEYFEDDIVNLFVSFVKACFGDEYLEENLEFIADNLGKNSGSNREKIRSYLLKNFYQDHLKQYQKRPIYWLFDSGKENAFKCLVYMHRYEVDLVSRIRNDYLHKTQHAIEERVKNCDNVIDNSDSKAEISRAKKLKTKFIKQLNEISLYDVALAHVANKRIGIDLDDGVKVNYAKFQNIEVVDSKTNKKRCINLLKKI